MTHDMRDTIREVLGYAPDEIVSDGTIHRFPTRDHPQDKAGYCALYDHGDGFLAGYFGDWRSDYYQTWHNQNGNKLTPDQSEKIKEAKARAREERDRQAKEAAEKAKSIWNAAHPAPADHPYLASKGIQSHLSRIDKHENLVIPVMDPQGDIHSLQTIRPDGEKRFLTGGRIAGHFFPIKGSDTDGEIVVAEGLATAASIHEAMGGKFTVLAAFNAGNLKPVAMAARSKYPQRKIKLAADNDHRTEGNPGLTKAKEAAEAVGGVTVWPDFDLDDPGTDFNDLAASKGFEAVKAKIQEDSSLSTQDNPKPANIWDNPADLNSLLETEPEPIKWFAHDRLLMGRGVLVTGIGGSSKTRLLYHLAVGAAIRRLSWDWEIASCGRTVLVLTEDTKEDVHRTLHTLCTSLELSESEKVAVYDSIVAYPLAGTDATLLQKTATGALAKTDLFLSLADKIKSLGDVVLVGLDPALSFTEGDEMDQGNQRALGKMIDDLGVQTGACCCLVTHATKASLQKEELGSHNSRGGGAITDAVRAEYAMRTMTPEEALKGGITDVEERKRHVQLVATKGNLLPPGAYVPVWLRRDDFGMLHQADINLDGKTPSKRDMDALEILQNLSKYSTPPLKEWRAACVDEGIITGKGDTAKKNMQRTVNKLKRAGLIEPGHGRGIYIPTVFEEGT